MMGESCIKYNIKLLLHSNICGITNSKKEKWMSRLLFNKIKLFAKEQYNIDVVIKSVDESGDYYISLSLVV